MKTGRKRQLNWEKIKELYYQNFTTRDIAKILGYKQTSVKEILRDSGVAKIL